MQSPPAEGDAEPGAVPEEGDAGGEQGPSAALPAGAEEEVPEVPSDDELEPDQAVEKSAAQGFAGQGEAGPSAFRQHASPALPGPAAAPALGRPGDREGANSYELDEDEEEEKEEESYSLDGEGEGDDFDADEAPPVLVPSQSPKPAGTPGSTLFAAGIDEHEADRRQQLHEEQDRSAAAGPLRTGAGA